MSDRLCDHCCDLPATVDLCDVLAYCEPCFEDAGDAFALAYGWISREDAAVASVARAQRRAEMMAALDAEVV